LCIEIALTPALTLIPLCLIHMISLVILVGVQESMRNCPRTLCELCMRIFRVILGELIN
jgi:hypothetical protein